MEKTGKPDYKCYTWQQVGLMYAEELSPESAARRIRRWVDHSPVLTKQLIDAGWEKGQKLLKPNLVQIIFNHFGEP